MNLKKNIYYFIGCITAILSSCMLTTSKVKNPVFTNQSKLQNQLNSLVNAKAINIQGKETTTNNKTSTELDVDITNATNAPTAAEEQKAFEKSFAKCIKQNLKDPNEFDSYKISLMKKVENNGVTTQNGIGSIFKSSDL